LIDTILILLEILLEKEYQQKIAAINTVIVYCSIEEGQPCCCSQYSYLVKGNIPSVIQAADPVQSVLDIILNQAILSIKTNKKPTIYFLYLGNSILLICKKTVYIQLLVF
jgi:hypothetical protein